MSPDWRARLATLGVIVTVFAAGVVSGVAGDRMLASDAPDLEARVPDRDGDEDRDRDDDRDEDRSESGWVILRVPLSDDQRAQVDSVLAFYRAQVHELTDTYNDAYWSTVQSTREELRGILREDQRIHYDSLLAERDRRRRRGDRD
jgi:hypothetical protein